MHVSSAVSGAPWRCHSWADTRRRT